MKKGILNNMTRRSLTKRVFQKLTLGIIKLSSYVLPQEAYMNLLIRSLRRYGMNIHERPIYIAPNVWFDPTDYHLISIAGEVVISKNVSILTHDYSISRVRDYLSNRKNWPEIAFVRSVTIGKNSFIGLGAILMPGTDIGANCIIGSGSVVRGKIPDGSLVVGNPARIVGSSIEWGTNKLSALDTDLMC